MLPLYIATLIFGGVFVVVSVLSGLGDTDFDADHEMSIDHELAFDHDFDHDLSELDAHAAAETAMELAAGRDIETHSTRRYIPFFSFKFYTFTLAFFGLTGTILHFLWGSVWGVFGLSSAVGLLAGLGMTYFLHVANRSEGGRVAGNRDFAGTTATVTLPIKPGHVGKVKFRLKGQVVEMMAKSVELDDNEWVFDPGDECFVLGIEDGVVQVVSPAQLNKES